MDLLEIISGVMVDKEESNIVPVHVTEIELIAEVSSYVRLELIRLVKEGYISECRTLNDKAYKIID